MRTYSRRRRRRMRCLALVLLETGNWPRTVSYRGSNDDDPPIGPSTSEPSQDLFRLDVEQQPECRRQGQASRVRS